MSVVYFGFLDVQPSCPPWFIKLVAPQVFSLSVPCPGALKPREGLLLPALFGWPVLVSLDSSVPVAVSADPDRLIQEVTLTVDSVDYSLRLLIAHHNPPPPLMSVNGGYSDVVTLSNGSAESLIELLEPVPSIDSRSHALATFMALDKTVLFLSTLALNETKPGRVETTCECRDLLYPASPLAAFVRAICRVYLLNDMIGSIRPILVELCEEAAAEPLSKSLANQTIIASLSVRLWTMAVEIITSRMPLPFVIAIEEAFRHNIPQISTGSLLGAFLTACLVTSSVVFASQDLQVTNISADSLPLLVRVHTVVMEALISSVDSGGSFPGTAPDIAPLVQGLGLDVRNRATPAFNALVAKCREVESTGAASMRFPAIERVSESSILDRAAAVLRSTSSGPAPATPPRTPPFLQLLEDFKERAFKLKSKHAIHSFHQYHLHHYSFGTHENPQGPTLADTARRGA